MSEANGRTHEPTQRELVAELDGFRALMDERDRRYEERFAAAQRAIDKAEDAQRVYNQGHNDLQRAMKSQADMFISKEDAATKFQTATHAMIGTVISVAAFLGSALGWILFGAAKLWGAH